MKRYKCELDREKMPEFSVISEVSNSSQFDTVFYLFVGYLKAQKIFEITFPTFSSLNSFVVYCLYFIPRVKKIQIENNMS